MSQIVGLISIVLHDCVVMVYLGVHLLGVVTLLLQTECCGIGILFYFCASVCFVPNVLSERWWV